MTPLLKTLEDFVVRGGDEFEVPVDGVGGGGILKPRTKNFYSHLKFWQLLKLQSTLERLLECSTQINR